MPESKSIGLYTLGCKVAQYETEAIAEAFAARGYTVLPFEAVCDAYVINTCTVTAESDSKCRKYIRRAAKTNPHAVIAVCGCYSQRSPDEVAAIAGVDIVIGSDKKLSLVDKVETAIAAKSKPDAPVDVEVTDIDTAGFEPMRITAAPRTRAYVKIEDGCECRCSYCAIPDARGKVRSKAPADVICEVEGLAANGTREVVLTGIETGSYGKDLKEKFDLADLICELDRRRSCDRIRLGSLAPELIGEAFVEKVKGCKILAPHFHLSMQSGSDSILHAMKRRYRAETALKNINRLREAFPGAQFTTDLMVGFPGETEEDFRATFDFVEKAGFLDCHVFAFSRRKNTVADGLPGQIPEPVKRRRSEELIAEKNRVRDGILSKIVAEETELSALFETAENGVYTAHSDGFIELQIASEKDLHGMILPVIPVEVKDGIVLAKLK